MGQWCSQRHYADNQQPGPRFAVHRTQLKGKSIQPGEDIALLHFPQYTVATLGKTPPSGNKANLLGN